MVGDRANPRRELGDRWGDSQGRNKETGGIQRVCCCVDKNFNPVSWVDCVRDAQGQWWMSLLHTMGLPKRCREAAWYQHSFVLDSMSKQGEQRLY